MKRIFTSIEISFSFLACFIGAFLLFALLPIEGNYKLLVVESGSMEPSIHVGSLVLVKPVSEYSLGDIVTYTPSTKQKDKYVTHRLAGFANDTFGLVYQTKGDANKTPDPGTVAQENIIGKVLVSIPFVGWFFNLIKTPKGFILAVIVPATIVIYEELKKSYQIISDGLKSVSTKLKRKLKKHKGEVFWQSVPHLGESKTNEHFNPNVLILFLSVGISLAFVGMTYSFFSDIEIGKASFAATLPDASSSPLPSTLPLPNHIVINEVYYHVDGDHGEDASSQTNHGDGSITVGINNNGAGSTNSVTVTTEKLCQAVQQNQAEVEISIDQSGNTGDNQANGNTSSSQTISTGDILNLLNINISGGNNALANFCNGGSGNNHEWIELYNPGTETVNLKNWTITDNSGISVKIPGNRNLKAGEFALISKSNSTWRFWDEPSGTLKIPLGKIIGDGLDNDGDHLILKNSIGEVIDTMSYGDDATFFELVPASQGHSWERDPDGVDTDTAAEWVDRETPQPGV